MADWKPGDIANGHVLGEDLVWRPLPVPPPVPAYPPQAGDWGPSVSAPYGIHPNTGLPYSDKSKLAAGLLQVLIPLGIGRMYTGRTDMGIAQLLVTVFTCGLGAIWPFIDGIIILSTDSTDAQGRILRP